MMKKSFLFMLKALFALEIFTFLSWLFGYVEKRIDSKVKTDGKTGLQIITIHTLSNIARTMVGHARAKGKSGNDI